MSAENTTSQFEIDFQINLYGDKYTYIRYKNGGQEALRYGEKWRSLTGDGFIYSLAAKIEEMSASIEQAKKFPDIGPDPLKLDGEERTARMEDKAVKEILFKAMSKQQSGVPDQTALVWRFDLSKMSERITLAEARLEYARADRDKLRAEIEACLKLEPSAVRVQEGGGEEDLCASLAVTMAHMRETKSELKKLLQEAHDVIEMNRLAMVKLAGNESLTKEECFELDGKTVSCRNKICDAITKIK